MNGIHTVIPRRCDVVVIGGGPAGSATAGHLAKLGYEVVLFDKARHPRPQVGESIIPHVWRQLDHLGATSKIVDEGFLPKAGGIVVWGDQINLMRFTDFGYAARGGLHVERDRFDEILLRHAASLGAAIFENVIVRSVDLSDESAPTVAYEDRRGSAEMGAEGAITEGTVTAKYVVDASGPGAFLARQFNSRRFVKSDLKFLGLWGYYTGARYFGADGNSYPAERCREISPVTFVTSFDDGWMWHILLRNECSVGFVMNTDRTKGMNKQQQEEYFRGTCANIPYLRDLLAPATFVEGSMSFRPDYSYYNERFVGSGFLCVGDAAAFVDPIFSQGVLTALFHGSLASWAIDGVLRNRARKAFFLGMYERRVLQYYGFSRLLAFGDFGGEGIDAALVADLVKSLPRNELELSFAASYSTMRSQNLRRMVTDAGIDDAMLEAKVHALDRLTP